MNKHIKELLDTIDLQATASQQKAVSVSMNAEGNMFIKYRAGEINHKQQDIIRLTAALRLMLCNHRIRQQKKLQHEKN